VAPPFLTFAVKRNLNLQNTCRASGRNVAVWVRLNAWPSPRRLRRAEGSFIHPKVGVRVRINYARTMTLSTWREQRTWRIGASDVRRWPFGAPESRRAAQGEVGELGRRFSLVTFSLGEQRESHRGRGRPPEMHDAVVLNPPTTPAICASLTPTLSRAEREVHPRAGGEEVTARSTPGRA